MANTRLGVIGPKLTEADHKRKHYARNKALCLARSKAWEINNKKRRAEIVRKYRTTPNGKAACLLSLARYRAKRKGLPCDLDHSFVLGLLLAGKCQATGATLVLNQAGHMSRMSPTLDRRDNERGYTRDNVWLVSMSFNAAKGRGPIPKI
jgi:hypothetical protein